MIIEYISWFRYVELWKELQEKVRYTSAENHYKTIPTEIQYYEARGVVTYRPRKPTKLEQVLK
jgi:hypothetical protein